MSRKTPAPAPSAKPRPVLSIDAVAAEAESAYSRGRYKEACDLYKELLKRERRPAWVTALAACYAARAESLAAKSMYKEALALWRSRAEGCGVPLVDSVYLGWLAAAGERAEMLRLLNDGKLPEQEAAMLETWLAPLVLAAPDKALPKLPASGALLRQRPAALAALEAYQRADDEALATHLQAIPFRSPYRDLKTVLKLLVQFETDPEATRTALARMPLNGPFEALAAPLRAALLPGEQWLVALHGMADAGRQLLFDLKGCPDAVRPLLTELARLASAGPDIAGATLYDLLLKHRKALPPGAAEALCLRLLPHSGSRLRHYGEVFSPLGAIRVEHVVALAAEVHAEREHAKTHWMRMAELLVQGGGQDQTAALIWRHLADRTRPDDNTGEQAHYLERSIALDPMQADLHCRLVQIRRQAGDKRQADARLKQALALFPADIALLQEAVESALAAQTFKKALGLARQVLALDPINPAVRAQIGHALLSHGRKQIKAGKLDAARKELAAAEEWLRTPAEQASRDVLLALICDDHGAAATLLRQAHAGLGGALAGAFHLLLEAGRCGRDGRAVLAQAAVLPLPMPDSQAVQALVRTLGGMRGEERQVLAALQTLHGALKLACQRAGLASDDMLALCEACQRLGDKVLLALVTKAALARWPRHPAFVYFKYWERHAAQPGRISDRAYDDLLDAQDQALAQGDQRTVARIGALLDAAVGASVPFGPAGDDALSTDHQMVRALLGMVGEKAFLQLGSDLLGKRAFEALKRALGGDKAAILDELVELVVELGLPGMPGFPGKPGMPGMPGMPSRLPPGMPPLPAPPRGKQPPRMPPMPRAPNDSPNVPNAPQAPQAPQAQKDLFDD